MGFRRWLVWATSLSKMLSHKPSQMGKRVNRAMDKLMSKFNKRKQKHDDRNQKFKKRKPNLQLVYCN